MSSQRKEEKKAIAAPAAADAEAKKNPPRRQRMTQEQIDCLIRYPTVHMPEEAFRRLSRRTKELLTPEELAYQGDFPVPMGQIDDYLANICREINQSEARFLRERDRILNDYYTKGYAYAPSSSPVPAPAPAGSRSTPAGRRKFRPGATKSKQTK